MIIASLWEKSNTPLRRIPRDVLIVSVLVISSLVSFYLGYRAGLDATGDLPAQTGQGRTTSLQIGF